MWTPHKPTQRRKRDRCGRREDPASTSSHDRGGRVRRGHHEPAGITRARRALAAGAASLALLAACRGTDSSTPLPEPYLEVESVTVNVAPETRDGWPARAALVRVETVELMDDLLDLDSEGWFGEAGEAFRRHNPDILHDVWEVAAGMSAGPFEVARKGKYGAVLFCDVGEAAPPSRFEQSGRAIIYVGADGCQVSGECRRVNVLSRLLRVGRPSGSCTGSIREADLDTITFAADAGVNDDWPVTVEMVRIEDESDLAELLEVTSADWFGAESERFRRNHPTARYERWEVVPGTIVGPLEVDSGGRPFGGVLFCDTPIASAPLQLVSGDLAVAVHDAGCRIDAEGSPPARKRSGIFGLLGRRK